MSATVASNTNEPQRTNNDHPQLQSFFSSLPNDIVVKILAGVPRRYHPILSSVSKNFRSIVRSSVFQENRSLMGKDSFYVCFKEIPAPSITYHFFTLTENRLLVSIPFPSPPEPYSAALMVGPDIYFVGDYYNHCSRNMWILDSLSGKLREGPSMRVARYFTAVGLVENKIYVFGGCENEDEEIQAEVFDTKTQTWEVAPNPNVKISKIWMSVVSPSLDRKIYVKTFEQVIVYDPRDGKCDMVSRLSYDHSKDVCVIDNVLYVYKSYVGLMWYHSKEKEWRLVNGLNLNGYSASKVVALAEYNGKLVFIRQRSWDGKKKEIWCAMITLDKSGVEITGKVEWFHRVLSFPCDYKIMHCLGRTD